MLCVVKLCVETFLEFIRKTFERRVLSVYIRMADETHRRGGGNQLPQMTTVARFVAGKPRRCRVVAAALVTRSAGEGSVALACVEEFRIVELRTLNIEGVGFLSV